MTSPDNKTQDQRDVVLSLTEVSFGRQTEVDHDPYTAGIQGAGTSDEMQAVQSLHNFRTLSQQFMTESDGVLDRHVSRPAKALRDEIFAPIIAIKDQFVAAEYNVRGLSPRSADRAGAIDRISSLRDEFVGALAA